MQKKACLLVFTLGLCFAVKAFLRSLLKGGERDLVTVYSTNLLDPLSLRGEGSVAFEGILFYIDESRSSVSKNYEKSR